MTPAEYTPWAKHTLASSRHVMGNGITDYLNREDVRNVLHIPSSVPGWSQCANIDYHTQEEASMWIYPILKNKYRMMFYSGDTDGAIPTYGSREWINKLNWALLTPNRPWMTDN
jgi:Serine carboxypeptidase